MKTLIKFSFVAASLLTVAKSHAQSTGDRLKQDTRTVGHKTSEVAVNGAATVVDRRYEGKFGPGGQTVYINKYSHYYYVNHLGHKVYLKKAALRDHN